MSRNCKGRLSFVFKLVVAVCLTIFNALNVCGATIPLKGQTQGTSIGDGISTGFKVHHRQKRSSLDLAAICLRVRAYHGFHDWYLSPSYGCWCGLGQSGPGPALDSIDACCKAHDLCWQNLDENEGCGSGVFARYTYSINNGQVTCHSPNCKLSQHEDRA